MHLVEFVSQQFAYIVWEIYYVIEMHCIAMLGVAWYSMVLRGIAWYCMVLHGIA